MAWVNPRYRTWAKCNEIRKATGFRGGHELNIRDNLLEADCPFLYEPVTVPYTQAHTYRPDFILPRQGIILEGKGEFLPDDRQKMLAIRAQYPALDIRFVFSSSTRPIQPRSKTTYAMWCDKYGFLYADKSIPAEWLTHKPTKKTLEALKKLLGIKAQDFFNGPT